MPPLSPASRSSLLSLRAALADRTTRRDGGPAPADGLAAHLRVVVARVLRTGRGPAPLVGWVHGQFASAPPSGDGDPAELLAGRLLRLLLPPAATAAGTVGG